MTDILLCIWELVAIALNSGCEKVNPNAHSILQDAGAIGFGRATIAAEASRFEI